MKILYTALAKEQLQNIKAYIAEENPKRAIAYLNRIRQKIELLGRFPYIGKINATMDNESIREFVVLGYKVIYKINQKSITILALYKYIDFDEASLK